MFIEIDSSELITYLARKQQKSEVVIQMSELKDARVKIERANSRYRVILGDFSLSNFKDMCGDNFEICDDSVIVRNARGRQMKMIYSIYMPSLDVINVIEQAFNL